MSLDVLIVGQGLAGSLLAWELLRQQLRVMVVDNGQVNASQVAAGLINPVTGQRLVKSADIAMLLSAALDCYQELAATFQHEFFVAMPMLRILKNAREQQFARQRLEQAGYEDFIAECVAPAGIQNEHGVLLQQQTGYLKTRLLLDALRGFFIANGSYRQTEFAYQDIVLQPRLQWQDLQPKHIVFCEGHLGTKNPWFAGLPFQLAKGEILSCQSGDVEFWQILNFGYWLIPQQSQQFRIGATFEPGQTDITTTEHARQLLLQAASERVPELQSVEVLAHQAGIRPTTLDKQPFVGPHPKLANMHIFNGFGAKGSLSIPWYARQFVAALRQQSALPAAGHIQRYYETHFSV